jgi:hypothetical protein
MMPASGSAPGSARRIGTAFLCLLFAVAAVTFALTTFCAIANFSWRAPMFDQWREYETFLGLPFPQNVLQLANGHRPILPNLVRVAEIQWFGASQSLQIVIGSLCAFLSAGVIAFASYRERNLPRVARWAGIMLAVLGLLWLGNARRLLHGSEALHGYMPTLAVVCACSFLYQARLRDSVVWVGAACAACVMATFSFGLGLASFASALVLGLVLRLPWRWLVSLGVSLALCVWLYVFALPGNEGVRGQLRVDPLATLELVARWTAAPWNAAWFQLAPIPGRTSMLRTLPEWALAASARSMVDGLGISVDQWCFALGLTGICLFLILVVRIFRRGDAATRLESLAIGVGVYALGSALITVLGRLEYLRDNPDQIYADRYLAWPSLFWCSLALLLLGPLSQARSAVARSAGVGALLILPVALFVSQNNGAIWGAIVYRSAQQTTAALRSGVYDEDHFPSERLGREADLRQIALLRSKQLAMFADPAWKRLGTRWTGTLETAGAITVQTRWLPAVNGLAGNRPAAAHLEGWVTRGIATLRRQGQLVILSEDGTVAGFAEFSFIRPDSRALLLKLPYKRGFDGYIRDYDARTKYTLAVVDFAANHAIAVAELAVPASSRSDTL